MRIEKVEIPLRPTTTGDGLVYDWAWDTEVDLLDTPALMRSRLKKGYRPQSMTIDGWGNFSFVWYSDKEANFRHFLGIYYSREELGIKAAAFRRDGWRPTIVVSAKRHTQASGLIAVMWRNDAEWFDKRYAGDWEIGFSGPNAFADWILESRVDQGWRPISVSPYNEPNEPLKLCIFWVRDEISKNTEHATQVDLGLSSGAVAAVLSSGRIPISICGNYKVTAQQQQDTYNLVTLPNYAQDSDYSVQTDPQPVSSANYTLEVAKSFAARATHVLGSAHGWLTTYRTLPKRTFSGRAHEFTDELQQLADGADSTAQEYSEELNELMHALLLQSGADQCAVAIVYEDRIVAQRGCTFGTLELEGTSPDSQFRVMSISKPITAAAFLLAFEQAGDSLPGVAPAADLYAVKVSELDNPPIPKLAAGQLPGFDDVTVWDLLRYRGGFTRDKDSNADQDLSELDQSDLADSHDETRVALAGAGLPSAYDGALPTTWADIKLAVDEKVLWPDQQDPRTIGFRSDWVDKFEYTNWTWNLIGDIIDSSLGAQEPNADSDNQWVNYQTFVRDELLVPLDMCSTEPWSNNMADAWPREVAYNGQWPWRHRRMPGTIGFGPAWKRANGRETKLFAGLNREHSFGAGQYAYDDVDLGHPSDWHRGPNSAHGPYYGRNRKTQLPAKGWVSTVGDIGRFLLSYREYEIGNPATSLGMVDVDKNEILSADKVHAMWEDPEGSGSSKRDPAAWSREDENDAVKRHTYQKSGSGRGSKTYMIRRMDRAGVVILTNAPNLEEVKPEPSDFILEAIATINGWLDEPDFASLF